MQNLNFNLVSTSAIIAQLQSLFQNSPRQCLKQNASGWSTNERILLVRQKKLFYARKYPEYRQGQTIQIPQQYIKAFVNLQDIYEVNYLPLDKQQKKTISILIPQQRINQQALTNTIDKTQNQPQLSKQQKIQQKLIFIKWTFHFQYDLKQKLQQIRQRKKQQMRKKNQLNLQQDVKGTIDFATMLQQKNSKTTNQPDKTIAKQQLSQTPLSEYVNQIRKAKDYLKFKQNRQKLQKQQRRKNKPRQTMYQQISTFNDQQQNYPIMTHWRQFYGAIQQLNQMKNPEKTVYQYQLIVYKEIHHFKQTCTNIFKNYIFQKLNGINGQKWRFQDFYFYKGIWIKIGGKQLNKQFLMHYYISDLTNLLNKSMKIRYRVPDICLIEYLGWKALCMCDLPFSQIDKSQVYNLHNQTYDLQNVLKIKQNLTIMQNALNMKYQDIQKQNKKVSAPLGPNLRIFQYNPKKDLKIDQSTLQSFYYLTNFQNIFPLDFNYQVDGINLDCRFRPQIIGDVRQLLQLDYQQNTQLLSTAFMISSMNQQQKTRQDDKVVKTSQFIITERIPQFVNKLNNCELIIIDSYSLKTYMSQFGINMRYMYKVHQLAKIKYIRQMIEVQCLARTIKKMFNQALRQVAAAQFQQKKILKEDQLMKGMIDIDIEKNQEIRANNQQKFKQDQDLFKEHAIDFLNLIFGKGIESDTFWSILCQNTQKKYKVKAEYPFEGSPGVLLHAVLYNCGIQAIFDISIPLFKVQYPFSHHNDITLRPKVKSLQFPSFEIQKLIRGIPSIQSIDHPNIELLQSITLKLYKMDLLKNYYLYQGDFNYHLSFSKINVVKQNMQRPTHASSHHPSEISYFIANKSDVNFEKGMNLLNFCFSDFHPIYVSFYEEYSHSHQPQLLKKTAILQAIKCFGQFHPKTSQIYLCVYSQGYTQFYQKSLRSQSILSSNVNMRGQYVEGKYYSCMQYCFRQMDMSKNNDSRIKKQNCIQYLQMLLWGMKAAQRIRYLEQSLIISSAVSDLLNKFKLRNYEYHYELIYEILKIKMTMTPQKMFLYKLALLCINIQQKYNQNLRKDKFGWLLPAQGQQKQDLSTGIMNEYFSHQTHSLWLQNIFKHLLSSFQYFNHLDDLFNNLEYHLQRYDNSFFKQSLGYWDILIRLYGQKTFRDYLYETGNS